MNRHGFWHPARAMEVRARDLARAALRSYSRHGGRLLAAAVAFSSLLSVAPLLVIALHAAGAVAGEARARATTIAQLARWVGEDGAKTIGTLLDHAAGHRGSAWTNFVSAAVLVYASTRLFSQLKRALNHMWDVQARAGVGFGGKVWKQVRKRGIAFLMVLLVGVVIVAIILAETMLASAASVLGGAGARVAWRVGETVVSLAATTGLFAAIFKVLPDVRIAWGDAWRGALVTAALFAIGAWGIGVYLGHEELEERFGAAGSVVALMLWVHYSAQVFFVGAAWTGELARANGREIGPDERGVRVKVEAS